MKSARVDGGLKRKLCLGEDKFTLWGEYSGRTWCCESAQPAADRRQGLLR